MHIHVDKTPVANSVQPVAHMYKKNNIVMYMYMYVRPSQTDCVWLLCRAFELSDAEPTYTHMCLNKLHWEGLVSILSRLKLLPVCVCDSEG